MQPMKVRSQLVFLTLGNLAIVLVLGSAAWIAAEPQATALAFAATLVLQLALAITVAKRISASAAALGSLAKPLLAGASANLPAPMRVAELAEAGEKLVQAANAVRARDLALRAADRSKEEFFAILGHELRNPLGALAAAVHVLRNAQSADATQRATEVVTRQVEHMTRLVEDLLDLSRVSRGKVSLSRQPLNLSLAVEKSVSEMRLAGRLERHDVRLELAEAWARADEARIQQIVANLVGNAVKYTPDGGTIVVSLRRDRDEAVLRVRDDGVGMSPELAARAFDLFVQGDDSTPRGSQINEGLGKGLGIGLALVRQLAELHGGKAFAASSGPQQGSTFTITLPAIEARPEEETRSDAPAPQSRHRILVVEDNADARESMVAALELGGHRVYQAADGNAGILAVGVVRPDVAVIDLGLPGLDGYEVASTLRRDPECRDMVLVAITGREQPDSLRRAREAGFDDYLTKPVTPDRLVRLIDAARASRSRAAYG
jgi:signal transduction histidine kinase/CheY-like chemotaxis protein